MGLYLSIGLDFYLEIDKDIENESFSDKIRCSNVSCKKHHDLSYRKDGNFCTECGNAYEPTRISDGFSMPDAYEFCEQHLNDGDLFRGSNSDGGIPENLWRYNRRTDFMKEYIGDVDLADGGFVDLSKLDVELLISKFKKEQDIIDFTDVFERAYGKNKFKIKFGVFSEYS
jgi:hypothetical protein